MLAFKLASFVFAVMLLPLSFCQLCRFTLERIKKEELFNKTFFNYFLKFFITNVFWLTVERNSSDQTEVGTYETISSLSFHLIKIFK